MKKLLLILLIAQISSYAQTNIQKMDSLLNYYSHKDKMMGQFALKLGKSTVYSKTFGSDKIINNEKIAFDKNTRYRIGSITKMFTATMIMQLVEEKKITLKDKLSKYYPKVKNADQITIEQLLRHRSGIIDYVNSKKPIAFYDQKITKNDVLKTIYGYESEFEPDSKASYSNSNYYLLGLILQDITKLTYNQNLENRITKPLKLSNTYGVYKNINKQKREIPSYTFEQNTWKEFPETNINIALGAGNIVSTADDLNTFIQSLFNNLLVKKNTLDLMTTIKDGYGLGLAIIPFNERRMFGHGGKIDMFESILAYYPKENFSMAAIYNGINTDSNEINIGILSIYYQQPFIFPDFEEFPVQENELKKHEGIYKTNEISMKIKIFIKNGKLHAQATGQSDFQLTAKSNTEFTFNPARLKIIFEDGKLTLNQSGISLLFEKE